MVILLNFSFFYEVLNLILQVIKACRFEALLVENKKQTHFCSLLVSLNKMIYMSIPHMAPCLFQIAASLDKALNIALKQATSANQHVYKISLVKGL